MSTQRPIDPKTEAAINAMSRLGMAELYRFAPAGHPYFVVGTPECELFDRRFRELGGMSPQISRMIGWER